MILNQKIMKIATFKKRFLKLTKEQQETALKEMRAAKISGSYLIGIADNLIKESQQAFAHLIDWCESERKTK